MAYTVRLRLLEIINARGQTQREFAQEVGLSANTVSNLVRQPTRISFETIGKLKEIGVELDDLFVIEKAD